MFNSFFFNGKFVIEVFEYYFDGKIYKKIFFLNNMLDGNYLEYYFNGKFKNKVFFKNDK